MRHLCKYFFLKKICTWPWPIGELGLRNGRGLALFLSHLLSLLGEDAKHHVNDDGKHDDKGEGHDGVGARLVCGPDEFPLRKEMEGHGGEDARGPNGAVDEALHKGTEGTQPSGEHDQTKHVGNGDDELYKYHFQNHLLFNSN